MDQPFGLRGAGIKKTNVRIDNINHNKELKSIQKKVKSRPKAGYMNAVLPWRLGFAGFETFTKVR
jgi:hypothetical protein